METLVCSPSVRIRWTIVCFNALPRFLVIFLQTFPWSLSCGQLLATKVADSHCRTQVRARTIIITLIRLLWFVSSDSLLFQHVLENNPRLTRMFLFHENFTWFLAGVSITIPEGAVAKGQLTDIYLAISRDDKDRPKLTGIIKFHTQLNNFLLSY